MEVYTIRISEIPPPPVVQSGSIRVGESPSPQKIFLERLRWCLWEEEGREVVFHDLYYTQFIEFIACWIHPRCLGFSQVFCLLAFPAWSSREEDLVQPICSGIKVHLHRKLYCFLPIYFLIILILLHYISEIAKC